MIETALFIGRFQPLHNAHVKVIEILCKKYKNVIVGIGSSQYNNTERNPYTYEQRVQMITETMKELNLTNYKIIDIPDINDPPNWVKHVISLVPKFDVIITNNDFTKKLFEEKKYIVKNIHVSGKENLCATEIRKRIKNNQKWKHLVPKSVVKIIKS